MRFHKSKKISKARAKLIVKTPSPSLNDTVVIAHCDNWYDVRLMTTKELDDFVSDLLRAEQAALQSALTVPH